MITLYTPGTGFPDLEAKIAYGLARVGIEVYGTKKISILPQMGYYCIQIENNENKEKVINELNRAFKRLCSILLYSSHMFLETPGIKRSGKEGKKGWNLLAKKDEKYLLNKYFVISTFLKNKKEDPVCNHQGNKIGLQIGFSACRSYHHSRDKIDLQPGDMRRPTRPKRLCKTCGLLAILGIWFSSFVFKISDREIIVVPIPKEKIKGYELQNIFSLQHQLRKNRLNRQIPQTLIPLWLLSQIPSSSDILYKKFDLFIAVLSRSNVYRVDGLFLIPIENYLDFIRYTPYNIATIDKLLNTIGNKRYPKDAYDALIELNNIIYYRKLDSLFKFVRLYTVETTPRDTNNWVNLLYPETTKYLLKEVAMIKDEIIKNKGVRAYAKTLGYFIWNKDYQNYSYADGIRNATTPDDVRKILEKLQREAKLRYDQEKTKDNGNPPHIPHPDDLESLNEIMQKSKENFEQVKSTLYLLAFSFESYKTLKVEKQEV